MKRILGLLSVLIFPVVVNAANQTFIFSGTMTAVNTTITNPYDLATAMVNGTYNVNNSTYSGQGAANTLLLSNSSDFIQMTLSGQQTVSDIQRVVSGDGNDVIDLASTTFTNVDTLFYTGNGNSIVWGNSGNDTFEAQLSSTHQSFDGGPGTDTADFSSPMASYAITRTGADTFTINALNNSTQTDLAEIEFAQFSDQTLDLSTVPMPEPSTLCLLAPTVAGLLMRRRNRTSV